MDLFKLISEKKEKLSVIGLGYVGIPLAIAFAKRINVIGFDISKEKISKYLKGIDVTKEVGNDEIKNSTIVFTNNEEKLKEAKFHIIAVPTPINTDKTPDLSALIKACKIVGRNMIKDSVVVFESTVYPGVTEEICVPILETESKLNYGIDFKVGYSPERINPGDKEHRFENIIKVVSGMDEPTLNTIAKVYELVVKAGVYKAESIKVAEAAKVIENAQRDINIAFMNELSIILGKMEIDTKSVLMAAKTKWNFLDFSPGLVGGHCIGVDPYYLTYKAAELGYISQIILSGRKINDNMGKYIAENIIKKLISMDLSILKARVLIVGFTFKENCSDIRNTKVIDIIKELKEYGINPLVYDMIAEKEEAWENYGIILQESEALNDFDLIVFAVAHNEIKRMSIQSIDKMFKRGSNSKKAIIDIKGIFDKNKIEDQGYIYWRL